MKKWIMGVVFTLVLIPVTFAQTSLKDGIYRARFEKANTAGYTPSLTVRVQKGVIISVAYDEADAKGASRGKDAKIKKIFDEMAQELSSAQKIPLTKTQADKNTLSNFNELAKVILDQAAKAHKEEMIIVKSKAQ